MTFKDLKVGDWFRFAEHFGLSEGPFKKTGKRTYLYLHNIGWFKATIGTVSCLVKNSERPDNAPNEVHEIHINWHEEYAGYVLSDNAYPTRNGEVVQNILGLNDVVAENETNQARKAALSKALKNAKSIGISILSAPMDAEMVVVYVDGDEYLVIRQVNNTGKVSLGVANPRFRSKK